MNEMNGIKYREEADASRKYKEAYLAGIRNVIAKREQEGYAIRKEYCKDIFKNPEQYRKALKAMLGWPLTEECDTSVPRTEVIKVSEEEGRIIYRVTVENRVTSVPKAEVIKLSEEEGCTIYRVTVEVMDGLPMTGLLFKKGEEKRPLVIVQHGADGTPELVGNLYGDTGDYHHLIERVLKYNVNVFSAQMLIWHKDYQVDFDRAAIDIQLKSQGSSIAALEIYGLTRVMDYFEVQDYVSNFGMLGFSYGGFYTQFTAAVDPRIKSALSCSFFNYRACIPWVDWVWQGSSLTFTETETACLVYPRRLCIAVGKEDAMFGIDSARKEFHRLQELCKEVGEEWLDFVEFDGVHEFCPKDELLERLAEDIQ